MILLKYIGQRGVTLLGFTLLSLGWLFVFWWAVPIRRDYLRWRYEQSKSMRDAIGVHDDPPKINEPPFDISMPLYGLVIVLIGCIVWGLSLHR